MRVLRSIVAAGLAMAIAAPAQAVADAVAELRSTT
jgi:hypothetical protein